MGIQLVAIDLDGTLLNTAKRITDTTAAILRSARREAGVHIVLATARPPRSVMPFYSLLGLDTPMINYNGALVYDPPSGRVLMHRPIPLKTARDIVSAARQAYPRALVSAEVLDRWYTDRVDDAYITATAQLFGPDVVGPIEQWLKTSVTKLLILGAPDSLMETARELNRRFRHQVSMVMTEDHLVQIMHATVSKASALKVVAAELGVQREQVMAIGDNANDVGMFQWAGVAVAMRNSAPEALAAADIVTDDCDADGAAKAVHDLIIRGLPVKKARRP